MKITHNNNEYDLDLCKFSNQTKFVTLSKVLSKPATGGETS